MQHAHLLLKGMLDGALVYFKVRPNHTSIRLQGALQRNRCNVM